MTSTSESHSKRLLKFRSVKRIGSSSLVCCRFPTYAILNLIGNAVKYGKTGGHVWISAAQTPNSIQILVSDDGIGIAESDQAHIFERFYRADRSRDRSGSGLGLAIVQWIAELHGGSVTVQSVPGHGSCFTVMLPDAGGTE